MTPSVPKENNEAKMVYLIKRKPNTTREELVVHWYANHMPGVIERNKRNQIEGKQYAKRYTVSIFNSQADELLNWDGIAQLWYDTPLKRPDQASGVKPHDTFQQKVKPYWPWATQEYVLMDGELPLEPLTLNTPFPCTRSGYFKVTNFVSIRKNINRKLLFNHWINTHGPNVRSTMEAVGGFRYTIAHSLEPNTEPYTGMAELYFPDKQAWNAYRKKFKLDGFQDLVDYNSTFRFYSRTEMVGID